MFNSILNYIVFDEILWVPKKPMNCSVMPFAQNNEKDYTLKKQKHLQDVLTVDK